MKENIAVALLAGLVGAVAGGLLVRRLSPPTPDHLVLKTLSVDTLRVQNDLRATRIEADESLAVPRLEVGEGLLVRHDGGPGVVIEKGCLDAVSVSGRELLVKPERDGDSFSFYVGNNQLVFSGNMTVVGPIRAPLVMAQSHLAMENPMAQDPADIKVAGEFVAAAGRGGMLVLRNRDGLAAPNGEKPESGFMTLLGWNDYGLPSAFTTANATSWKVEHWDVRPRAPEGGAPPPPVAP